MKSRGGVTCSSHLSCVCDLIMSKQESTVERANALRIEAVYNEEQASVLSE